ncbi:cytochrome P450 [Rhodococcus sp. NPDC059968]|uniref:cytochrome P450 n=1 Tax=Rhodococcus sp. NPDC059968 TaxID=3347017 RepID=UPI00366FBF75
MTETPVQINYPSLEGAECPYPQYEWLREDQPVYRIPGTTDFLVTRYEDAAQVARDWKVFSSVGSRTAHNPFSETGMSKETQSLVEADPPSHRDKRNLCAEAFKPKKLAAQVPTITAICDSLIDDFIDKGEVDLVSEFAEHIPPRVIARMLGFTESDFDWLNGWSRVDNSGLSFLPKDVQERSRVAASRATEHLIEAIEARRDAPTGDELSEMIQRHVERDGQFDLDYILDNTVTLIRGGVITTAHTIATIMLLLLQNPVEMERVRADNRRIATVAEESLRIESPTQWVPRRVTTDTELGGQHIPAGSRVLIMVGAANRDEREFTDPTSFDADRKSAVPHMAFGAGNHFCLGAPLARLEIKIAFERLLTRLSDIRLAEGQDFSHVASAQFRGLKELRLAFTRSG